MLESRLRNVTESLTYDIYSYTCLGLFERHKLMFSFQMTIKILEGEGASWEKIPFRILSRKECLGWPHSQLS